jgi:hypothetical protein
MFVMFDGNESSIRRTIEDGAETRAAAKDMDQIGTNRRDAGNTSSQSPKVAAST